MCYDLWIYSIILVWMSPNSITISFFSRKIAFDLQLKQLTIFLWSKSSCYSKTIAKQLPLKCALQNTKQLAKYSTCCQIIAQQIVLKVIICIPLETLSIFRHSTPEMDEATFKSSFLRRMASNLMHLQFKWKNNLHLAQTCSHLHNVNLHEMMSIINEN